MNVDRTIFCENIPRKDCENGQHILVNPNKDILIQIRSQDEPEFPHPKYEFKRIVKFVFDDTEDCFDPNCITDLDAKELAKILYNAAIESANVVVHCYAGIYRSGAIVEAAISIGFTDVEGRERIPNSLVKRKVIKELEAMSSKL